MNRNFEIVKMGGEQKYKEYQNIVIEYLKAHPGSSRNSTIIMHNIKEEQKISIPKSAIEMTIEDAINDGSLEVNASNMEIKIKEPKSSNQGTTKSSREELIKKLQVAMGKNPSVGQMDASSKLVSDLQKRRTDSVKVQPRKTDNSRDGI